MSACYQGETNESFTAREIFTCFPHNITQKRKGKSLSLLYESQVLWKCNSGR